MYNRRMTSVSAFLRHIFTPTSRVYLDYAAATPVRGEVTSAMAPYVSETFANPGAIHTEGRTARRAVEDARERVARTLRIRPEGVTFVSGGTEANSLAICGVVDAAVAAGRSTETIEVMSTRIEHPSTLAALETLAARGVSVRYLETDGEGRIDTRSLAAVLSAQTLLLCLSYVNSEVGTVEDVRRVARVLREHERTMGTRVYLHVDASQAPLWLPCALDSVDADLMTLDSGKCYGPKGVGVLARRGSVALAPQLRGGDQERGLRAGTENVPLIVGCAAALARAQEGYVARSARVTHLRDLFFDLLREVLPTHVVNGSRIHRVANNVNISLPGVDGEFAVVTLDVHGIAASTRSACAGGKGSGSHVVRSLSGDEERAASTIRFTLGEETTRADIERAVAVVRERVLPLWNGRRASED